MFFNDLKQKFINIKRGLAIIPILVVMSYKQYDFNC